MLAAARIVRLVRRDRIAEPFREALVREGYMRHGRIVPEHGGTFIEDAILDDHAPLVFEWLSCSWCVGMWAAALVVAARKLAPRAWDPVARVLAASFLAAVLETRASEA